jgi:hypothetical protein
VVDAFTKEGSPHVWVLRNKKAGAAQKEPEDGLTDLLGRIDIIHTSAITEL